MWPQTTSRHFCLLDFFLSECLGATLWHICPDCSSVLSTSVVFRSWGFKWLWKKRMNTSLSHSTVSRDLLNTFHRERERQGTLFFPCLLKAHLFEEMRRAIRVYSESSVCLSSAYITWTFLWMWKCFAQFMNSRYSISLKWSLNTLMHDYLIVLIVFALLHPVSFHYKEINNPDFSFIFHC